MGNVATTRSEKIETFFQQLAEMDEDVLTDSRSGTNKRHLLVPLLRQSIYSRLAGYEDVNDAERLCIDPAMINTASQQAVRWCGWANDLADGNSTAPQPPRKYASNDVPAIRNVGRLPKRKFVTHTRA